MISSLDNVKIKYLIKLKNAKYRKLEKKFIVEGSHLVMEAQQAGVLIEAYSLIEKPGYIQVSEAVMKKICNTDTLVSEVGLCHLINKASIAEHVLILDGIQDPGNMGTLLRSAVSFGFSTVFVGNGSVDIYNDKVIRSSQGAIFKLNFLMGNVVSFINSLKDYKIYNTNVTNGISLEEVERTEKLAIILGNEGNGVSQEICELGLPNIYIPMQNMESLNVAVAGSIIMYNLRR